MGLRIGAAAVLTVVLAGWPTVLGTTSVSAPAQTRTHASLWYRGQPAGVPRQADLDSIAAAGFSAVTWPVLRVEGAADLRRMAASAGLQVVIRTESVPVTPETALKPDSQVDILVPSTAVRLYQALMWRSVAHGARIVSFDAGLSEGTGLRDASDRIPPWVAPASAVARQLVRSAIMVDTFKPGPAVRVAPASSGLDIALLDAGRAWVLIATNVSPQGTAPADTFAFLPRRVPPAEWLNLLDASTIGMLRQPEAVRWHVVLGPGDIRVYAIDKIEK